MKNQSKAFLYAGFVILCWSTVATAFKVALIEMSYTELVFIAGTFASLIYLGEIIINHKSALLFNCLKNKKTLLNSILLGIMNPLLYYLVLFKAYSLLPAQIAQPINCSWQILLPLLAILLLKRKVSLYQLIGLLISFTGIIFISSQGNLFEFNIESKDGILLAIASAFIWALYWIAKIKSKTDPTVELFIGFLSSSILLGLYFCFTGFRIPSFNGLLAGMYVGTFEMGLAFICWAKALKLSNNTATLSQLTYLAPFISLLLIHFILGEEIYWTTITGLVFIICGIIFSNFKTIKKS